MTALIESHERGNNETESGISISDNDPPSPPRLVNVHHDHHELLPSPATPTKPFLPSVSEHEDDTVEDDKDDDHDHDDDDDEDGNTQPSTTTMAASSPTSLSSNTISSASSSRVDGGGAGHGGSAGRDGSHPQPYAPDNASQAINPSYNNQDNNNNNNLSATKRMSITVTVLSLQGLIAKQSKNKKGCYSNPTANIIASFSQNISSQDTVANTNTKSKKKKADRVFLTHVPSLPVLLAGDGSNKPVVNWPANDANSQDHVGDAALSTLQFKREFVQEDGGKVRGANVGRVNVASANGSSVVEDDTMSRASKASTTSHHSSSSPSAPSSSSSTTTAAQKTRFLPQTCPINLSISRNGKMALLGKVNLIINGEENGETSLTVPITSSIPHSKSSNVNPVKQVKKMRNKNSPVENLVKIKNDSFQFGLEQNSMLRVLVSVVDPTAPVILEEEEDGEVDSHALDESVQGGVGQQQQQQQEKEDEASQYSMEGLSIEHQASDDSSLEHDDYQDNYILKENELRTLKKQLQEAEHTNEVLQMELANATSTASHESKLVAALHCENSKLRTKLEDMASVKKEMQQEFESLGEELEVAAKDAVLLMEENELLKEELDRQKKMNEAVATASKAFDDNDKLESLAKEYNALSQPGEASATKEEVLALQNEIASLKMELLQSQTNSTTLLTELNTAKSESELLPFYETRVNELLEELKKRDLEVSCLKEELEEVKGYYKVQQEQLVEGLLWDNNEDSIGGGKDTSAANAAASSSADVEALLWDNEDESTEHKEESSSPDRLASAAALTRKLAAAGLKVIEEKVVSRENSDVSVDKDGPMAPIKEADEEEEDLEAQEKDSISSMPDVGASVEDDSSEAVVDNVKNILLRPIEEASVEEGDDTDSKILPRNEDSDTALKDEKSPSSDVASDKPDDNRPSNQAAQEDDGSPRKGWGVRRLGGALKGVEERMRERQLKFREQQQRLAEEQRRLAAEKDAEPGLGDVLMLRISNKSSHGVSINSKMSGDADGLSKSVHGLGKSNHGLGRSDDGEDDLSKSCHGPKEHIKMDGSVDGKDGVQEKDSVEVNEEGSAEKESINENNSVEQKETTVKDNVEEKSSVDESVQESMEGYIGCIEVNAKEDTGEFVEEKKDSEETSTVVSKEEVKPSADAGDSSGSTVKTDSENVMDESRQVVVEEKKEDTKTLVDSPKEGSDDQADTDEGPRNNPVETKEEEEVSPAIENAVEPGPPTEYVEKLKKDTSTSIDMPRSPPRSISAPDMAVCDSSTDGSEGYNEFLRICTSSDALESKQF